MSASLPIHVFYRTALTGGAAGSLDGIDGNSLAEGYRCEVEVSGVVYIYWLNASSGAAESSPGIISPDTNAGNKRWILAGVNVASIAAGPSAPTIMFKKLTGTTSGSEGGIVSIAHGLTPSKIIGLMVLVFISTNISFPHAFSSSVGYFYDYYLDNTNIAVINHATSSENILSKPIVILITYEA